MVMCTKSEAGKVEVIAPPAGAVPGDLVMVDGYPRRCPASTLIRKQRDGHSSGNNSSGIIIRGASRSNSSSPVLIVGVV